MVTPIANIIDVIDDTFLAWNVDEIPVVGDNYAEWLAQCVDFIYSHVQLGVDLTDTDKPLTFSRDSLAYDRIAGSAEVFMFDLHNNVFGDPR